MTTILVWLGSGFAFAVGVCFGADLMRRLASESSTIGIIDIQKRANELLEERISVGERQAEYLRQIADTLQHREGIRV